MFIAQAFAQQDSQPVTETAVGLGVSAMWLVGLVLLFLALMLLPRLFTTRTKAPRP